MADEKKSSWVADVFGNGGAGNIVSGAGDVICAIKGTCVPNNVTYSQGANVQNNSIVWVIVAIAAIGLIAFMMLKK